MSPQQICLENLCPECNTTFSAPTALLNHLRAYHSIIVTARTPGRNRPSNSDYLYVKNKDTETRHSACPCCWAHFPIDNIEELKAHIRNDHLENGARETSEEYSEYEVFEEHASPSSNDLDGNTRETDIQDEVTLLNEKKNSILNDLDDLLASLRNFTIRK
ncbi:hypothetical protein [Parasitella parasitica]|uniref:C2H2-type domain-containing protein n=1 Tax=Parasitella parasitica TaxID=35722 RepID=A0A0B7NWD2_9FUNG|nr:hypothetical protein [Parasitella parasitica]